MFKKYNDILILISRLIIGGIFLYSGWVKVSDMATTVGYFSQMNIPVFLAYVISYAELLGGLGLILGLWSELASLGLLIIMVGAVYFGVKAAPSMNLPAIQVIIPNIAIISALIAQVVMGPGKIAIPAKSKSMSMDQNPM